MGQIMIPEGKSKNLYSETNQSKVMLNGPYVK